MGLLWADPAVADEAPAARPSVEVLAEEEIYRYAPANNGAGPLWCHGSTSLVRSGDAVFAAGLETLPAAVARPLNNCRWVLYRRRDGGKGWERVAEDAVGRTREPSPVATFADGRFFLSANPTTAGRGAYSGPSRPEVLEFHRDDPARPRRTLRPVWSGAPAFSEHSYRSLAADPAAGELILFQNVGYTHAEWAFFDRRGEWVARGQLAWPRGDGQGRPAPVRVCYPNVALAGRAVHFCGVSDIQEPNLEWRAFKRELTGQPWDYDFRRLFYTWSEDISGGEFAPWVEVASRDATAGWMQPGDLWVGPDGAVHVLWTERAIDERLRERFFPEAKQRHALRYAQLRGGEVVLRRDLIVAEEGGAAEVPGRGRFHVTPAGRLYVFFYVSGRDGRGRAVSENRLFGLGSDGRPGPSATVPFDKPFTEFMTATVRAGSAPSDTLELLGQRAGDGRAISYGAVRVGGGEGDGTGLSAP